MFSNSKGSTNHLEGADLLHVHLKGNSHGISYRSVTKQCFQSILTTGNVASSILPRVIGLCRSDERYQLLTEATTNLGQSGICAERC